MVLTAVSRPATQRGIPNSRWNPNAAPRNSARSVAMATSSMRTHMMSTTGPGNRSRQASARLSPVAMPSLAESACTSMAERLLATRTQSRV